MFAVLCLLASAADATYLYRNGERLELQGHPSVVAFEPAQSIAAGRLSLHGVVKRAAVDLSFIELGEAEPTTRARAADDLLVSGAASRLVPVYTSLRFGGMWLPTRQVMWKAKRASDEEHLKRLARSLGLQQKDRLLTSTWLFAAADEASAMVAANELYESGLVEYATVSFIKKVSLHFQPNDEFYAQQWHFERIHAEAAWDITKGSPETVIAIIDTGVDSTHPEFAGKLVDPYDAARDLPGSADPEDYYEAAHGTACAGDAAASTDNHTGVAGVCPNCKIMPIRLIAFDGVSDDAADVKAFDWATTHGADVISNSWGASVAVPVAEPLAEAVRRAVSDGRGGKGAVVLFAAGNSYRENFSYEMASMPEVIAVGASTPTDRRFDYSDYGPFVQFLSPSASVTTDVSGARGYSDDDYTGDFGGTSSACPVAAGVVGLLLSQYPTLDSRQVKWLLTQSARKANAAEADYDAAGFSQELGFGVIDAQAALQRAAAGSWCEPSARHEVCGNGLDDDCNSLTDNSDPECAPSCSSGCPPGTTCNEVDNHCRKTGTGVATGGPCTVAVQCAGGVCLGDSNGYPEGYCSSDCSAAGCPDGASCIDGADGSSCFAECQHKGDCRHGYVCLVASGKQGVCLPACKTDSDCEGKACDTTTGVCEGATVSGGGRLSTPVEDPLTGGPSSGIPKGTAGGGGQARASTATPPKSGCTSTGETLPWVVALAAWLTRRRQR